MSHTDAVGKYDSTILVRTNPGSLRVEPSSSYLIVTQYTHMHIIVDCFATQG